MPISDSDIDCSDDESEQETIINCNIQVESVSTNGESEELSESEDDAAQSLDWTRVSACVDMNFCESEVFTASSKGGLEAFKDPFNSFLNFFRGMFLNMLPKRQTFMLCKL
jgi:hypothetical protein